MALLQPPRVRASRRAVRPRRPAVPPDDGLPRDARRGRLPPAISRARIGAVRGVNVDGVVRTLLTRGLITEVTKDEESGATLYGTTPYFLERMGLNSLDDLPALAPYLPDAALLDDLVNEARP